MAQVVKDSFLDLERHRQLLEANLEKLRKSLELWQMWEVEYEGLKEEILGLGPSPTHQQLVAVGKDFDGQLITQAEVEDILGVKAHRTADQVVNLVARRIDYVAQNVKTLEKQIEAAENKLAAATVISNPDVRNEEGLPLTEIIEELDEDGNVIFGRTETQGSAKGQLMEVLEKAGVKDIPRSTQKEIAKYTELGNKALSDSEVAGEGDLEVHKKNDMSKLSDTSKKAVQFAEDTKAGRDTQKSQTQKRIEGIMKPANQQTLSPEALPVIPNNESTEEAALRREMLEYSLSEIGPIVAELDLEEASAESGEGDDYYDDTSDMDDEDEFGRSKKAVMNEELRQRMMELEEKLGFSRLGTKAIINLGPNPEVPLGDIGIDDTPKVNGKGQEVPLGSGTEKKSVRFSEDVKISPAPDISVPKPAQAKDHIPVKSPVGNIIERTKPKEDLAIRTAPARKQSRFKNARGTAAAKAEVSPIPESKTLADTIIEREPPKHPPPEPDELDPALLQQEVAMEYYRIRNRMIQKQGGFSKDPDEPDKESGIIPHTEEDGGPKRMSRFKAARIARS